MVHLIWLFVCAVATHWYALAGGVIAFGVGLWERAAKKPLRADVFWAVALLTIFFACFSAWKDEHHARAAEKSTANQITKNLQNQIDVLSKPFISGQITQRFVMSANTPTGLPQMEVVEVRIENIGTPTVLTKWNLVIQSGTVVTPAVNCVMPAELNGTGPMGVKIQIRREYMLQEITSKPIERGGMRVGWLVFEMDPNLASLLNTLKKGAIFYVSANDAFARTYIIHYVLKDDARAVTLQDIQKYSPGSGQIFFMPPPTLSQSRSGH